MTEKTILLLREQLLEKWRKCKAQGDQARAKEYLQLFIQTYPCDSEAKQEGRAT